MINLAKRLLSRTLQQTVERVLSKDSIAVGLETGLLTWAKFSTGVEPKTLVPGSIQFAPNGLGLQYQVE
jgi:hypothetical protein